ncbi:hypothetical protein ACFQ08_21085, partial [Streptosporangium algeriense]
PACFRAASLAASSVRSPSGGRVTRRTDDHSPGRGTLRRYGSGHHVIAVPHQGRSEPSSHALLARTEQPRRPENMNVYKKALPAAIAAAALATLTAAPASAAPTTLDVTVKVQLKHTSTVKESAGVWFTCPENEVLTGRSHSGDENGYTTYYCSSISINDQPVQHVVKGLWSAGLKESRSAYVAPGDQAIIGRWHSGDENGTTKYLAAMFFWQGKQLRFSYPVWSGGMKESRHSWRAGEGQVMTGRQHMGDENGTTKYQSATVTFVG